MMEGNMTEARVGMVLCRTKPPRFMKALSMFALVLQPSRRRRSSIFLSFGIVASAMGCTQADRFYAAGGAPAPSFAPIVQEVMPAVVNVSAVQRVSKAAADGEGTQAATVK